MCLFFDYLCHFFTFFATSRLHCVDRMPATEEMQFIK